MACFFTDWSFKCIGELPKVLLVHQRCQWHRQYMHCWCHWHRRRHASPVSLTPAKLAMFTVWHRWCMTSPVSMKLVTCFSCVIDTGKYMLRRCHWHRWMHALPVSMTPVRNFLPVSLTPVKLYKIVKCHLPVSLTPARNPVSMTPAMHALPLSLTPAKHQNNRISPRIFEKNRNCY